MATKVPNPVDKYVGSRVRMRRQILGQILAHLIQPVWNLS